MRLITNEANSRICQDKEGITYQDPYLDNYYKGAKSVGLRTGF